MQLYNLKHPDQQVSFRQATLQSIGRDSGLFFPSILPRFDDIDSLLSISFVDRSSAILQRLLGDELGHDTIDQMVRNAFTFPVPVVPVEENISTLELFHGPTLAFKDFGARFMAQVMSHLIERGDHNGPLTILSATSGDTGAAVAHAFHNVPNIQVVVLYPKGKISSLQEKLFCTLGGNIHTIAVESDFDTCQDLIKQCFADSELVRRYGLNSANSINISRLIAQTTYYFEAAAQRRGKEVVISVPSGNFGNLTAGLIAQSLGAPIKAFIASTNINDTVPRYLATGDWRVNLTQVTMSNAMDVSAPNNWPRIEALFARHQKAPNVELRYNAVTEAETTEAMLQLKNAGYISEPHGAVAYASLKKLLLPNEHGVFLGTAHPAKFKESVETILQQSITLPEELQSVANKKVLSSTISADKKALTDQLLIALNGNP